MATHGFQRGDGAGRSLPDAIPFDLAYSSRLSWELGSRIVDDDETSRRGEWLQTDGPWLLSIFQVTENTVVMRVETPVGRERFYGVAQQDLEAALPELESASNWHRRA
ncbi:hypothetical protein [Halopiger goleimassiliensis]|uniref:hypothetical protein n=1 Tax=Halopiger goleimassiliensis TaxID=1293048 RepID=UPI000677C1E4|nr:hypothetical protein [Halopiger goleimassiliensis]